MVRHAEGTLDHRRASYPHTTRDGSSSHAISSAFSASAQPNEDWTKISDLAERRRIQNRIAQRNYRKKLKKRLEDLERKAGSASSSPELKPVELPLKSKAKTASPKRRQSPSHHPAPAQSLGIGEDWTMFADQHTRRVSPSPPPFSLPTLDALPLQPSPQVPLLATFPGMTDSTPEASYQFQPLMQPSYDPLMQFQWQDKPLPIKQEAYLPTDTGMHAFMPVDDFMPFGSELTDTSLTPELCDMYEYNSSAGSPSAFPQTPPLIMSLSPPFTPSFEL